MTVRRALWLGLKIIGALILLLLILVASVWIYSHPSYTRTDIPRYAELVYYGYWYSPERLALQSLVTQSQKNVTARCA